MDGFECTAVTGDDRWHDVLRLRTECYARNHEPTGIEVTDRFDGQDHCRSHVLTRRGGTEVLGTIRPCTFDPRRPESSVPAFDLYPEAVAASVGGDVPFVQSTYFAVSPALRGDGLLPKLLLFREVYRKARQIGAAFVLTVVKQKGSYVGFYSRLGFKVLAAGVAHPVFGVPTVLLAVDITADAFRGVLATERFAPIFRGLAGPQH